MSYGATLHAVNMHKFYFSYEIFSWRLFIFIKSFNFSYTNKPSASLCSTEKKKRSQATIYVSIRIRASERAQVFGVLGAKSVNSERI